VCSLIGSVPISLKKTDIIYEQPLPSVVGEGLSPGTDDKKRGSVRGTSRYGRIKYKVNC